MTESNWSSAAGGSTRPPITAEENTVHRTFRAVASVGASMALTTTIVAGLTSTANAEPRSQHAVFVQTDNLAGNEVVAYQRNASGTLTEAGRFATGGLGGLATGAVVDPLASQGSLVFDDQHD